MKFELDDEQVKKYLDWYAKLPEAAIGAIGGRIVFSFCNTSIGQVVRVRDDVSDLELDLTDYDSW